MAHSDNSDLDPSWQDLDRYVPTPVVVGPVHLSRQLDLPPPFGSEARRI